MTDTIDKVIFALDGDLGPLKDKGAQVQAEFDKMGQGSARALGAIPKGAQEAAASVDKLGSSFRSANPSKFFSDTQAGSAKLLAARAAMDATGAAAHGMTTSASIATREFRALFDELSSGRTRMVPGTLAIIASRVFGLSLSTLAWGVAIAAIPVAFIVAAAQADSALAKIRQSLVLTGNASGVTSSQLQRMAEGATNVSTGRAQSDFAQLARMGVPGADINQGRIASENYSQGAGVKPAEANDIIGKMFSDPKKSAEDLTKSMFLLNSAQEREVNDLVASGQAQKASELILAAFSDRAKEAADNASGLSKALAGAAQGAGNFWSAVGRALTGGSLEERLASDKAQMQQLAQGGGAASSVYTQKRMWDLNTDANSLQKQIDDENRRKSTSSQTDSVNTALGYKDKLMVAERKVEEENNARTALTQGLKDAKAALDQAKAKGDKGEISGAQKNYSDIQTELNNANNPNYKWGTGIPKGPRAPKNVPIQDDEAEAEATRNRLQAELELTRSFQQRYAIQQQLYQAEDRAKADSLKKELAEKRITPVAASNAEASDTAAEAARDALAKRKLGEDIEDQQNDYAKQLLGYQIAALEEAAKGKITVQARNAVEAQILALRQQEARTALETQLSRNPNLTDAQKGNLRQGLATSQAAESATQTTAGQDEINAPTKALQAQIDLLRLESSLKYADAASRAKEIADQEAINELAQEHWKITDAGYAQALALRTQLKETQASAQVDNSGLTNEAQLTATVRQGLLQIGTLGEHGFKNAKDAAHQLTLELANMILKLYILEPLMNSIMGTGSTMGVGGAPTSLLGMQSSGGGLLGNIFGGIAGMFGMGGSAGAGAAGAMGAINTGASTGNSLITGFTSAFGGGLAGGGGVDPNKFYLVGENGPEYLGPGVRGAITPIKPPSASAMASQQPQQSMQVQHNYAITVGGNGDAQLLERMADVATAVVKSGIHQYSTVANRTQRGRLAAANKRAIR